jgi:hypothetical protein
MVALQVPNTVVWKNISSDPVSVTHLYGSSIDPHFKNNGSYIDPFGESDGYQ